MKAAAHDLAAKLGLIGTQRACTLHAPAGYGQVLPYPTPVRNIADLEADLDWLQAFYMNESTLAAEIDHLKSRLALTGQLWICWPKQSSGVASDLNDNVVRAVGLAAGLVDVKVAAIDATWSGLKFVYRVTDR